MYLYTPLLYAFENPDKARVKIFYYPLEEDPEEITQRFMSFLLNRLTKSNVHISPTDLQSSKNVPVSQEILNLLETDEYKNLLQFYEDHVEFSELSKPTAIFHEIEQFMQNNGKTHYKEKFYKDEFGELRKVEGFDYYEPNDPDLYVIVIVDHISLLSQEPGLTLKQTIDRLSDNFVKLRNRYKITPVLVQQQSFEGQSLEAFKLNKLEPSAQGLADTKYTARNTNQLLGLFNPSDPRINMPNYGGYDIEKLDGNVRFLEVILNRGGRLGGRIGLFFDGATCDWKELPPPSDKRSLEKVYNHIRAINTPKSTSKVMLCLNKLFKVYNGITNRKKKTTSV
jgi:hypothetical protein